MKINPPFSGENPENVILKPNPQLPLVITGIGIGLLPLPIIFPWPSVLVSSFGLFLLIQTLILRLEFTKKDLIVWQLGRELRRFPFNKWLAWRIFLPKLPGILYFREEASPHLLPIIFEVNSLKEQLRLKVKDLEIEKAVESTKTKN